MSIFGEFHGMRLIFGRGVLDIIPITDFRECPRTLTERIALMRG